MCSCIIGRFELLERNAVEASEESLNFKVNHKLKHELNHKLKLSYKNTQNAIVFIIIIVVCLFMNEKNCYTQR